MYGVPEEKGDFINRILDRLKRWKTKLEEMMISSEEKKRSTRRTQEKETGS